MTALFVTHDQEDAFAVADRVAIIRKGKLLQVGPPEELYDRPASREVAEFIGHAALVPARWRDGHVEITVAGVTQRCAGVSSADVPSDVLAVLRPDALALGHADLPGWRGRVATRRFAGALMAFHVVLADGRDVEVYGTERGWYEGDNVSVRVAREPVAVVAP